MLLHFIILVDFNKSWFLVITPTRTEVSSQIQILGLILSERREGSSPEPSTSCSALSIHLRF